uniref:RHS repeat-associated core domain-containing protein n=1 Tax=Streptomyces dangxiongensis TaxID=1442032 RepID=UPI001F08F97A|nr:RHS repeat-associated core domain-containing protein [Streptomyces dangxiongensis]
MGHRRPPDLSDHPRRHPLELHLRPARPPHQQIRLATDGETVIERTDFTWDGTTLCEQTTVSAQAPNPVTLTWDHHGPHPITQTERITSADAPQHEIDARFFAIITDLVGTPNALVDERGDIAWQTRRTLWGATAWTVDSTAYTPLRFPGQYFDPETGLHYNHFRHYDPETARYLTLDPLGLAPAPNPASYVPNPHLWADPLGLTPCKAAAQHAKDNKTTPLGKISPHEKKRPSEAQPTTTTTELLQRAPRTQRKSSRPPRHRTTSPQTLPGPIQSGRTTLP